MRSVSATVLALAASCGWLVDAQNCPSIHIFGARETTVGPGYGSAGRLVDMIRSANPGATSEAITYPACGGQASCGGIQYGDSVRQGTAAVATAVNSFNQRCPNARIVLVGYSQGGQIMDNALCGGPDSGANIGTSTPPISAAAIAQIRAAIFLGDPRWQVGLASHVGTCTSGGFSARPAGYVCANAAKLRTYCDNPDPYCCRGNDANHHQQYVTIYGQQALTFVNSQLSGGNSGGGGGGTTTTSAPPPATTCAALWGQCGGQGWTGPTCCSQGTCRSSNQWYSQCLN